jgi:acyl carrier protein
MSTANKDVILSDVLQLLNQLARDWEYSGEITLDTWLFGDLGFESIDAVVLASFVQEHYGRTFPFPQLLADIGQRETKDMRISELVSFIHQHLNSASSGVQP